MDRSLDEILQSVSDVLFPDGLGETHVDINCRGAGGDSPLHVLAWRLDVDGMQRLLEAGADVDAVGEMGQTPLLVAIALDSEDMVKLLLEADAHVMIRSEFDKTALDEACEKGGRVREMVLSKHGTFGSGERL
jgi:ankyrin repeat protein